MRRPIPHACPPGVHCGQCQHNTSLGMAPNHPGNDRPGPRPRPRPAPPPAQPQAAPNTPLSWVPVPPPAHTPARDRLVITIAIGQAGRELHELTGPSQRAYAEKVGAEYVVLTDPTQHPKLPCFEKFRYRDWVRLYPGGSLCIDADAFVFPDAPDVFAVVPPDRIGLRDIRGAMSQPDFDRYNAAAMANLCRSQGVRVLPASQGVYWNSGVWVGRPEHADYWTPPPLPVPGDWCDEEGWCRRTVFARGLRVHELGWGWNWTWCEDREFRGWELPGGATRRPWVAHLAGMGNDVPWWVQPNAAWRKGLLRVLRAVAGGTVFPSEKA